MTDGNQGFGLFLLGRANDIQEMGRLAAEPWNQPSQRPPSEPLRRGRFQVRLNRGLESRLVAPEPVPPACCLET